MRLTGSKREMLFVVQKGKAVQITTSKKTNNCHDDTPSIGTASNGRVQNLRHKPIESL